MTAVLDVGSLSWTADLIDEINDVFLNTHVSVTGTRHLEAGTPQDNTLRDVFGKLHADGIRILHHGLCIGADELAHGLAFRLGWEIHGHPGPPSEWQMTIRAAEYAVLHPVKPFKVRDADIANAGSRLIAIPAFPEAHPLSRRSGTWVTVHLARVRRRPITYIWPDGSITTEGEHS